MTNSRSGSIRLFRVAGIDLFLHWSWFLVAAFEVSARTRTYSSISWNILEYLALFFIVMLHEYGHALACRSVGGKANRIVLWPLGGVAYVNPPARPGATLWSIVAGPMVNLALVPVLWTLTSMSTASGWAQTMPDLHAFLRAISFINLVLLVFNLLPIYPLDGGQIVRSLLWFVVGRARSLMAATVLGLVGVAALIFVAIRLHSLWFLVLSAFMLMNCWNGLKQSQALSKIERLPRREGFTCPTCKAAPPVGEHWRCTRCGKAFDTFQTQAVCPYCSAHFAVTTCMNCHTQHPISEWTVPVLAATPEI